MFEAGFHSSYGSSSVTDKTKKSLNCVHKITHIFSICLYKLGPHEASSSVLWFNHAALLNFAKDVFTVLPRLLSQYKLMRKSLFGLLHVTDPTVFTSWFQSLVLFLGPGWKFCICLTPPSIPIHHALYCHLTSMSIKTLSQLNTSRNDSRGEPTAS